jgi:predicted DNA-binding WGR domain protein
MNNETISLAFNDLALGGSSDKVYHLALEQTGAYETYNVTAQYGRRGAALTSQCKTPNGALAYDQAKKVFEKIKREKMSKGYIVEGTAPEPQIAPSGASLDIKPPELLEEITNGQGPARYISDNDYWMQDKSDGVSRGVIKQRGEIVGMNKLAKIVALPAELVAELSRIELETFQIDAELVGNKLVCRDLLVANKDISQWPYEERFACLVGLLQVGSFQYAHVVETWTGEAKAEALPRLKFERREGVVFKLRHAPYRAGRNGQHKKYKFIKTLSAVCGLPRESGKESIALFLCQPDAHGKWIGCGTVSLIGKPAVKQGDIVEVQYLYAQKSGLMVQARMKCVRRDVLPEECTTAQLIYKREEQ